MLLNNKLLILASLSAIILKSDLVSSIPLNGQPGELQGDRYPVMVPVSSTVIPLQLFGKPKPLQGGGSAKPRSNAASTYLSPARRMRLLERSRRPDEPVRLITKNSKNTGLSNDTH